MTYRLLDMRRVPQALLLMVAFATSPGLARAQAEAYNRFDKPLGEGKALRLYLPKGTETIRGIVIMANAAGSDSRDWAIENNNSSYIELARRLRFGMLGTVGVSNNVATEEGPLILSFLDEVAGSANVPELRNVPFLCTGFSAGGQFAYEWNAWKPERTIAFNVDKGGNYRTYEVSAAALRTPGILISGADDTEVRRTNIRRLFTTNRPRGARWAFLSQYAYPHNPGGTQHVLAPFFGRVANYRYPPGADAKNGPPQLRDIPEAAGWLADNATWASGFTTIAPFAGYAGNRREASWLPDEATAALYRAFASYVPAASNLSIEARRAAAYPVTISEPRTRVLTDNAMFTFAVNLREFDIERLEFYAGAVKLGETMRGATPSISTQLRPGEHGLHVIATDRAGKRAVAKPVHVHVRGSEAPLPLPSVDPSFAWNEAEPAEAPGGMSGTGTGGANVGGNMGGQGGEVADGDEEGAFGGASGEDEVGQGAEGAQEDGDDEDDEGDGRNADQMTARQSGGCSVGPGRAAPHGGWLMLLALLQLIWHRKRLEPSERAMMSDRKRSCPP